MRMCILSHKPTTTMIMMNIKYEKVFQLQGSLFSRSCTRRIKYCVWTWSSNKRHLQNNHNDFTIYEKNMSLSLLDCRGWEEELLKMCQNISDVLKYTFCFWANKNNIDVKTLEFLPNGLFSCRECFVKKSYHQWYNFFLQSSSKEQALYFQKHSVCALRAYEVILCCLNLVANCQQITPSMAAIASE